MCAVAACGMRCYAITTREGSSGEIRRQGASLCAPAFWRAYLLQRTGPGRAIGWGFGSHYTFSSAEECSSEKLEPCAAARTVLGLSRTASKHG